MRESREINAVRLLLYDGFYHVKSRTDGRQNTKVNMTLESIYVIHIHSTDAIPLSRWNFSECQRHRWQDQHQAVVIGCLIEGIFSSSQSVYPQLSRSLTVGLLTYVYEL